MYLDSLSPASPTQGPLGPARRGDWRTPVKFFAMLDREFHFALDACSTYPMRSGIRFLSPDLDGLWQPWGPGPVFLNPPYGRDLAPWLDKAVSEAQQGVTTVALVPARMDVAWWHDLVMPYASEVRAVRGRLHFDDGEWSAPFASVVIIFRPGVYGPPILASQSHRA